MIIISYATLQDVTKLRNNPSRFLAGTTVRSIASTIFKQLACYSDLTKYSFSLFDSLDLHMKKETPKKTTGLIDESKRNALKKLGKRTIYMSPVVLSMLTSRKASALSPPPPP